MTQSPTHLFAQNQFATGWIQSSCLAPEQLLVLYICSFLLLSDAP